MRYKKEYLSFSQLLDDVVVTMGINGVEKNDW